MGKNKKYYKNNNYYHKKNKKEEVKKVTYDSLMNTEVIAPKDDELSYDKTLVLKCIAVSVVLFAIIICSLLLFSKM